MTAFRNTRNPIHIKWQHSVRKKPRANNGVPVRKMSHHRTTPTPTMEEDTPTFQPISPVVQTAPPTPQRTPTRQQVPQYIFSPQRLMPHPMPAFQIVSPYTGLTQTPRAFLRSTTPCRVTDQHGYNTLNPPRSEAVPILAPTIDQGGVPRPDVTITPPILTPYMGVHTTSEQGITQTYVHLPPILTEQPIPIQTEGQAMTRPQQQNLPHTSNIVAEPTHPQIREQLVTQTQPQYQSPFRAFIPSINTVSSLKRQLNKLEAENYRLRMENDKKYEELQQMAETTKMTTLQLQAEMKEKLEAIERAF